jgi:thiol-disulfide isomerase/thioredoxin
MKKRYYTLAILSLVVLVAIMVIYGHEKSESASQRSTSAENQRQEGPTLITGSDEGSRSERLFEEIGVVQIPPTPIPIDISLPDLNGMVVKFSDFKGKIVFLNFWATWCPPCRFEMPAMEKLHKKLKNKDFVMLAVDLQEPAAVVKKYFKKHKLTFMSLMDTDGEVSGLFGVRSIPTTFILDKEGRIIGGAVGAREWNGQESVALFEHLINQEAVPSS